MKKIGVLNCSHIVNFGSVLQSYATEYMVRKLTNQEVISIRYRQKKDLRYIKNYLPQLFEKEIVLFKWRGIKRKLYLKYINKDLGRKCKERELKFNQFVSRNFHFSRICTSWSELKSQAEHFECFVLGSDQVWHPINLGSHFYTMEWIPDRIPKITYAASFGVSTIPNSQLKCTKTFLERIDYISVRESRGAELVKEISGRTSEVVVDPTLLLSREEWDGVAEKISDENYILCYFLGGNEQARSFARKFAIEKGLPIYAILFMDEINSVDHSFGDKVLFDVGPGEFLSYVKKARYIITDSFHGTVFSIIYHKQFVVFNRFYKIGKQSTNSRIDTLLDSLDIQERRVDSQNVIMDILDKEIDYESLDNKLENIKEKSVMYLEEALSQYR